MFLVNRLIILLLLISSLGVDVFLSRSYNLPQPGILIIPITAILTLVFKRINFKFIPIWLGILIIAGLTSSIIQGDWYRSSSYCIVLLFSLSLASSIDIMHAFKGTVKFALGIILGWNLILLVSEPLGRFGGIWQNPNLAGIGLLAIWLLIEKLDLNRSWFLPTTVLIFATISRSAIFLLLILFIVSQRFSIKQKIVCTVLTASIVVSLVGVLLRSYNLNPSLVARMEIFSGDRSVVMEHDNSTGGRIFVIQEYLRLVKKRPLLGYGSGFSGSKKLVHTATHNFYLMLMVDFGLLVSLVVFLFLFFEILKSTSTRKGTFSVLFLGLFYHDIILLRSILLIIFISYVRNISENKLPQRNFL